MMVLVLKTDVREGTSIAFLPYDLRLITSFKIVFSIEKISKQLRLTSAVPVNGFDGHVLMERFC